jgi:peroxiredoxin
MFVFVTILNEVRMVALAEGTKAPNFTLHTTHDQEISLSDFKGQPVILVFYPADWSPVCSDQLSLYNELIPEFQKYRAQLLGLSVDNTWCHSAFAKNRNFRFSLLSDFEPKGKVARDYGVYQEQRGVANRALFVIDENGIIRWNYLSPMGVNPGADGILKALDTLQKT